MGYEKIIVFCTAKDFEEGRGIAHSLVKQNLAACVNIVPSVVSVFRWKERIEEESEVLLIIKTSQELFETLTRWIKELHSYEVPEIVALKPVGINPDYEDWWEQEIADPSDLGA